MIVTEHFRDALRAWLAKPGNSQRKLALAIGCHPSNISMLLNKPDDYKASDWVLPIARHTGITLPEVPVELDPEDMEALALLTKLRNASPEKYEAYLALLRTID